MSRRTKLLCAIFALGLFLSTAAAIFLTEITLHLHRRPIRHRAEFAGIVHREFQSDLQDVSIVAADGVTLRGWFAEPQHDNGSTVILLHGVTDNREGVAGYSRKFLQEGYRVLLPDSRAHGESDGTLATYGLFEREDVHRWAEWARSNPNSGCVYLFGESMGAAIALQATARDQQLCAVAVESPYSTFREVGYDRIAQHAHLPLSIARIVGAPTLEIAFLYARVRYRVDLREASPEYCISSNKVPLLLIAGTADQNIRERHSRRLQAIAASHAQFWEVAGADHGGAVVVAPSEFWLRILTFYKEHPSPPRLH